jgi:hypothetical protein
MISSFPQLSFFTSFEAQSSSQFPPLFTLQPLFGQSFPTVRPMLHWQ